MKKLKLKILSLITCIIMLGCTLTGCALAVDNKAKALSKEAIKVGSTVLTKQEVVNLWYSFYNENASYFYYYTEEQILDIFYKNVITKYAIMEETQNLIKKGTLVYTEGDEAKIYLQVLNYISSQLDTREKALYLQQGTKQENLPARLADTSSSENSEVKSYLYQEYSFNGLKDYECKYTPSANKGDRLSDSYKVGKDVTNAQVDKLVDLVNTYIYKDEVELDEDEQMDYTSITHLKQTLSNAKYFTNIDGDQTKNRTKAFEMYVGNLMLSAKANGQQSNRDVVLFNEVKRLYINYYENYIYNMYSNYINSLINKTGSNNPLSDKAVVARYLQLLGKDIQSYTVEENYIAVVEASSTNSLLLYHFEGEYYYFTVQHLLVGFDDQIKADLAEIPGSNASASEEQYNIYKKIRDSFYKQLTNGDKPLESWGEYKNVTYRDDNGYEVYVNEAGDKVYFDKDYVVENPEDTKEGDKLTAYYYIKDDSKVYLTNAQFKDCKLDTITISEMESIFNSNYSAILNYIKSNSSVSKETIKEQLDAAVKNHTELDGKKINYSLSVDLIGAYLKEINAGGDLKNIEYKLYTNLFMQHAFKYSADSASLGNDLSNRVGMIIGQNPDNNTVGGGTYVAEFTNGARELLKQFNSGTLNASSIGTHNYVISDYGIHFVVINDVYKGNKPVTGDNISYDKIFEGLSEEQIAEKVAEAVEILKSTYVCKTSSQTLYEYVYEILLNELVGSNGILFTQERNKIYNDYIQSKKAVYIDKMSYDQLMDAIR